MSKFVETLVRQVVRVAAQNHLTGGDSSPDLTQQACSATGIMVDVYPGQHVSDLLRQRLIRAAEAARQINKSGPVQTIAALLGAYGLSHVELRTAELAIASEHEYPGEVPDRFPTGRMVPAQLKRYTIALPFDGDPEVVKSLLNPCLHEPKWKVAGQELQATFTVQANVPGEKLRTDIDASRDDALRHVEAGQGPLSKYRADLIQVITTVLDNTAAAYAAGQAQRDALGLPVRPPAASPSVTPAPPQRPAPTTSAGGPVDELDTLFEKVMIQVEAIGRDLEGFTGLNHMSTEEHTRDVIIVALRRAVPECEFTGESVHGQGKNDIHVRCRGVAVCVIELKKWASENEFKDGIDQLLSYLTHRDTRGAYVLLIRTQDVSSVIGKTKQWLKEHANCTDQQVPDGQRRSDFQYHATGDPAQPIKVVYLPFAFTTSATGNSTTRGLTGAAATL